jgi:hypothetical protein
MIPTLKGYYIVTLPEITGNKDYTPTYSDPIPSYTQMLELSRLTKAEHYVVYWDGFNEFIVRL